MTFTALLVSAIATVAAPTTMVVRSADGTDRSVELSQLGEVSFDDEMVCVKTKSGADFTIADSQFVSLRFNNERPLPDLSSLTEVTADAVEAVYDLNGRYAGASVEGLRPGVYVVVKPGCKATRLMVK